MTTITATLDPKAEAMLATLADLEGELAEATAKTLAKRQEWQETAEYEQNVRTSVEALRGIVKRRGYAQPAPGPHEVALVQADKAELLDAIDRVFERLPEPTLGDLREAISPMDLKYADGDHLRRLLYAHPERGWKVGGTGRGARWRKVAQ